MRTRTKLWIGFALVILVAEKPTDLINLVLKIIFSVSAVIMFGWDVSTNE